MTAALCLDGLLTKVDGFGVNDEMDRGRSGPDHVPEVFRLERLQQKHSTPERLVVRCPFVIEVEL